MRAIRLLEALYASAEKFTARTEWMKSLVKERATNLPKSTRGE